MIGEPRVPTSLGVPLRCIRRRRGQDVQAPVATRTPMRASLERDGAQTEPLQPLFDRPGEVGLLRVPR
eukprot:11060002-Lingulodinium_polyedra.AAC.1